MDRLRRLSLALGIAAPLLLCGPAGLAQAQDDSGYYGDSSEGSYEESYEDPYGSGQDPDASGEEGKNPGRQPENKPGLGATFIPPPEGDSDDTPALAAAVLGAVCLGGAAFVLGWGRRTVR